MPRVVHFEICADEPERAAQFYQSVFGWNIRQWDGPSEYWLLITGEDGEPGINGGLVHRGNAASGSINFIDVPSLDTTLMHIADSGGDMVHPRATVPGIGYIAYCRDTEGNEFGIIELDDTAE